MKRTLVCTVQFLLFNFQDEKSIEFCFVLIFCLKVFLFVVIAFAYGSAEEVTIEKEIEKVPVKIFPAGVDPLLCPNYPDCNNALLHSRKVFYPNYLHSGFSPISRSIYSPSIYNPSIYSPVARSVYNPSYYNPGRYLVRNW